MIDCLLKIEYQGDSWEGHCEDEHGWMNHFGICSGDEEGDCMEMLAEEGFTELPGMTFC